MPTRKVNTDRRVERTRNALMNAFVELLLSQGYATLSVERIAARADVGRSTFYMHFKSREDMLKQALQRPSAPLAAVVDGSITAEALVPQLVHFVEQRRKNRVFFESPVRELWVKCLADMIEPRLANLSRKRRGSPVLPLAMIAAQIADAQVSLVSKWLALWPQVKPLPVAEAFVTTTRAQVAALLRIAD
jgi:AcrR family transcriptional regulator